MNAQCLGPLSPVHFYAAFLHLLFSSFWLHDFNAFFVPRLVQPSEFALLLKCSRLCVHSGKPYENPPISASSRWWRGASSFAQTTAPDTPSLTIGAEIKGLRFDWEPVAGASWYELEYQTHIRDAQFVQHGNDYDASVTSTVFPLSIASIQLEFCAISPRGLQQRGLYALNGSLGVIAAPIRRRLLQTGTDADWTTVRRGYKPFG